MKGRRAKKGAVLATAVVFMTIIIALSVLVVVFASSSTKRAVNAAKRANSSIEANIIGDEFVASVKDGYEEYNNASDESGIRELPVATINAHMNEFAHKINENYSCEVSVSASKTYSLKLIEKSGEKETQTMLVSVKVDEVKDEEDANKIIGYTYSVLKWNLSDSDFAKLNVIETFDCMNTLASDYLDFYFKMKNSTDVILSADVYQLHLAELLQFDRENNLPQCYLTVETKKESDEADEIIYYVAVAKNEDGGEYILFKYRLKETTEGMPELHIYIGEDEYVLTAEYREGEVISTSTSENTNEAEGIKTITTTITYTYTPIYTVNITKASDGASEYHTETMTGAPWTSTSTSVKTVKIEPTTETTTETTTDEENAS